MPLLDEPWPQVPRLVAVYDTANAGRWDHDFYLHLADELGVDSVLDIGCGTGLFATDVAARGLQAIGLDPAEASLELARRRPGGDAVRWIDGAIDRAPDGVADLAIMMGHVAQYFVDDGEWADLLGHAHRSLRPGGWLAFETRNPVIDWADRWVRSATEARHPHPDGGTFTWWTDVHEVTGPAHSYTLTHQATTVLPDGEEVRVRETLRFRSPDEVVASVTGAGFAIESTWGDWDRSPFDPERSRELIVLAGRR